LGTAGSHLRGPIHKTSNKGLLLLVNPLVSGPQVTFFDPNHFGIAHGVINPGNAFGQNPQPQANPMFGNLATNPNPNPGASPFGASLFSFSLQFLPIPANRCLWRIQYDGKHV
jgi:hypothetical protein